MTKISFYVVMSTPEACASRISEEAYKTFEEAVEFIKSRSGNPQPLTPFRYRDDDYLEYEIFEVTVHCGG